VDEFSQPDAPDDIPAPPAPAKRDPTRNSRKARWRKKHPQKAFAALAKWRAKNASRYRDYQRRYMAARRAAAKAAQAALDG
jgi:hypothetical protein